RQRDVLLGQLLAWRRQVFPIREVSLRQPHFLPPAVLRATRPQHDEWHLRVRIEGRERSHQRLERGDLLQHGPHRARPPEAAGVPQAPLPHLADGVLLAEELDQPLRVLADERSYL